MKQILFVIAMKKEATDIAEKLKLEKINEKVYRKENISLIMRHQKPSALHLIC